MHYQEIQPRPALRRFLRCFWTLRGAGQDQQPLHVVPDGCPELVLNLADAFREQLPTGLGSPQPSILLAGQMERPLLLSPSGCIHLIGLRFQPGGLYSLLGGLNVAELNERRLDLADLARDLTRELIRTANRSDVLSAIEDVLMRRLQAHLEQGPGAVERTVRAILDSRGTVGLADRAQEHGLSERQLQRRFRRQVGITAKRLASLVRFQQVFRCYEAGGDWASVALDCGYFDQSHLIRDFRRYANQSPACFFAEDHPLAHFFSGSA